jgi:hypothetical protein
LIDKMGDEINTEIRPLFRAECRLKKLAAYFLAVLSCNFGMCFLPEVGGTFIGAPSPTN